MESQTELEQFCMELWGEPESREQPLTDDILELLDDELLTTDLLELEAGSREQPLTDDILELLDDELLTTDLLELEKYLDPVHHNVEVVPSSTEETELQLEDKLIHLTALYNKLEADSSAEVATDLEKKAEVEKRVTVNCSTEAAPASSPPPHNFPLHPKFRIVYMKREDQNKLRAKRKSKASAPRLNVSDESRCNGCQAAGAPGGLNAVGSTIMSAQAPTTFLTTPPVYGPPLVAPLGQAAPQQHQWGPGTMQTHGLHGPFTAEPAEKRSSKAKRRQEAEGPYVKKPPNAFMMYLRDQRPHVMAELKAGGVGAVNSSSINSILGQRWKAMPKAMQDEYYKMADRERQIHSQLYPEWTTSQNYGKKRKRIRRKVDKTTEASGFASQQIPAQTTSWCTTGRLDSQTPQAPTIANDFLSTLYNNTLPNTPMPNSHLYPTPSNNTIMYSTLCNYPLVNTPFLPLNVCHPPFCAPLPGGGDWVQVIN